jgi:hypothetical protein
MDCMWQKKVVSLKSYSMPMSFIFYSELGFDAQQTTDPNHK